jgi:hypothetical protein
MVTQFPVDVGEGRSLPNVLKRISNLLALKSTVSTEVSQMKVYSRVKLPTPPAVSVCFCAGIVMLSSVTVRLSLNFIIGC